MAFRSKHPYRRDTIPTCVLCDEIGHRYFNCRTAIGEFKIFGYQAAGGSFFRAASFPNGSPYPFIAPSTDLPMRTKDSIFRNARRVDEMPFRAAFRAFEVLDRENDEQLPGRSLFTIQDKHRFPSYYIDMKNMIGTPAGCNIKPENHFPIMMVGCEMEDAPELARMIADYYIANGSTELQDTSVGRRHVPEIDQVEVWNDFRFEGSLICNRPDLLSELLGEYVFSPDYPHIPPQVTMDPIKDEASADASADASKDSSQSPSPVLDDPIQTEDLKDATSQTPGVTLSSASQPRMVKFGDFDPIDIAKSATAVQPGVRFRCRIVRS